MTSTWHGLEIGKRALFAQQAGLNTVGHNVANANTPGYSRQRVQLNATASMEYPGLGKSAGVGQIGTGVVAGQIERMRETFLDNQFRNESKSKGEWEVRLDTLDKMQALLNEPSDTGLSKVLDTFFLSWQTLGRNKDMPSRNTVKQATIDLVGALNNLDIKLKELDQDIAENVTTKINEFNSMTQQIVDVNKQITALEVLGDNANDLRDRRDLLVDQLSKIGGVTAKELPNGTFQVSVGGQLVVNGGAPAVPLTYDAATNTTSVPVDGGEIGGMVGSRTDYMSVYKKQLDSLVNGLVNGKIQAKLPSEYTFDSGVVNLPFDIKLPDGTVKTAGTPITGLNPLPAGTEITFNGLNDLHSFGYTATNPAKHAGPLFETTDGSTVFTAGNIRVAQDILDDVQNIASSDATYVDAASGDTYVKQGNGDLAFMIGETITAAIDFRDGLPADGAILAKGSVSDYMRAVVGQLGLQTQTADRYNQNQDSLLLQINNRRQSVSGVSIDEEMANMIKYQQSYGAAARVISTIDTMLDTIINRMGH
ncbi:MAG TPA: flagellar hook-associated protein FlgK [Bacilli bacterium]|nr:flagellar hook-associated protein FlgK [Bacilli bacterium]